MNRNRTGRRNPNTAAADAFTATLTGQNRPTPQPPVWVAPQPLRRSEDKITLTWGRVRNAAVAMVGGGLVVGFIGGLLGGSLPAPQPQGHTQAVVSTPTDTTVSAPLEWDGTPIMRGPNAQEVATYIKANKDSAGRCVLQWHPADTGWYEVVC